MNSNQQTLQAYEAHVQDYINGTPQEVSGILKDWLDEAQQDLPKTAAILELGSATGRDAEYLQSLGYTVQCTDATQAFVVLLKQNSHPARLLNAITDELGGPYGLVLANAVLLHFTREETQQVLGKVLGALTETGRFAFTLKAGEGETWSEAKLKAPRYFCLWTEEQIRQLLATVGFSRVTLTQDISATTGTAWLQIIAYK